MSEREIDRGKLEPKLLPQFIEITASLFGKTKCYVDDGNVVHAQTVEHACREVIMNSGYPIEVIIWRLLKEASPETKEKPFFGKLSHTCQEDFYDFCLSLASFILESEIKIIPGITLEEEKRKREIELNRGLSMSSTEVKKILQFGKLPSIELDIKMPSRS